MKNLIGNRFGKLVVIARDMSDRHGKARWLCLCDCGNRKIAIGQHLKNGRTRSCGCIKLIHGKTGSPEWNSWQNMKDRCTNPHYVGFGRYGGRGITFCDRWKNFTAFLSDMGPRLPGTSLDRVNVDGNYEPSNCRWATAREQSLNRRSPIEQEPTNWMLSFGT